MQIPFTAYAEDCLVNGALDLRTDRLSDFLAATEEFEVDGASLHALDDGRVVEADSVGVARNDLCIVLATGPRGRIERRLWTRQHPVRARVGPYVVIGYLHAPPTIDPLRGADRRPIVALTGCAVGFAQAGTPVWVEADAVLVNAGKIDVLEAASDEDLRLARQLDRTIAVEPRAKDMTAAH